MKQWNDFNFAKSTFKYYIKIYKSAIKINKKTIRKISNIERKQTSERYSGL